ncbi:MAG TPA: SH3 domain-containing protein [Bauldia sp.]|nr:SH3 domain-containing protein [Bauldia sp.]
MLGRGLAALAVVVSVAGGAIFMLEGGHAAVLSPPSAPVQNETPDPAVTIGKSGLPLPRFVSLKAGRVNVRVGPGEDYKVAWVFTRSALPVEVIQEFDTWRRIRDSDGQMGWVFHSLLSAKRTAIVTPWASGDPLPLRAGGTANAAVTAYLQPGVEAAVDKCRSGWCDLSGTGFSGWIEQTQLWGVYPGEAVD